jgi:Na+/proline symporter
VKAWGWLVLIAAVAAYALGMGGLVVAAYVPVIILFGLVRFVKWAWESKG